MLWSALQATQLIHIDRELATGLRAVRDIVTETQQQTGDKEVRQQEVEVKTQEEIQEEVKEQEEGVKDEEVEVEVDSQEEPQEEVKQQEVEAEPQEFEEEVKEQETAEDQEVVVKEAEEVEEPRDLMETEADCWKGNKVHDPNYTFDAATRHGVRVLSRF